VRACKTADECNNIFMSSRPELVEKAEGIIQHAHEYMGLPDYVQTTQHYTALLGGVYNLELRAQSSTSNDSLVDRNSRYLYLTGPHEAGHCRPTISLDINALTGQHELRGLLDRMDEVPEILAVTDQGQGDEATLLELVMRESMQDARNGQINPEAAQHIGRRFVELLDRGSTITVMGAYRQHNDTQVGFTHRTIEGSLEHVTAHDVMQPKTTIVVHGNDAETQSVLDEHGNLQFECYEQTADSVVRMAAYANEKDIIRDENGKIIAVALRGYPESAIRDAEKALGLRDLEPTTLAYIEKHVKAIFV